MSATRTLRLDQVVEGAGAVVNVRLDPEGSVVGAWFAMDGMPRVEPLLVGRPVADVPGIIERLCGICPVAHHLAGVQALEALAGTPRLTPTADAMRRLLHHGAVLQTHAQRLSNVDPAQARDLSVFARRVVAAAGGDSHFPQCAVPGGVLAPLAVNRRDELLAVIDQARVQALGLLAKSETHGRDETGMPWTGRDVALVARSGALDLYGDRLRAVAADGSVTIDGAAAGAWPDVVAVAFSASAALSVRGVVAETAGYRVGPVAQLRVAPFLATPLAAAARRRWSASSGNAAWARAVVTLHVVEVIDELLRRPELLAGPVLIDAPIAVVASTADAAHRQGSGWVDGARGLLVHTYRTDGGALLRDATITTPTAQNQAWLAEMLRSAFEGCDPVDPRVAPSPQLQARLEAAIREADPCLPCTSSPPGGMRVRLRVTDASTDSPADREGY